MPIATFVAAAAHDMKNSVSVVAAYLEDALAEIGRTPVPQDSSIAQSTCQALYETQRLNGNLVQLMALFKLDEGMYPFDPVEVALDEFAAEVLERVRPLARLRGQEVALELGPDVDTWVFDHDLLVSVVVQSLFNAVRYANRSVRLSIRRADDGLEIETADDGRGFPPFMLEQGFATMQGIDTRTGSTGLGLYFSRRAAALHRRGELVGTTHLANGGELGGGRFVVRLP